MKTLALVTYQQDALVADQVHRLCDIVDFRGRVLMT